MPNISQGELLIIAAIIAALCFMAMIGVLGLLFWWFKFKKSPSDTKLETPSEIPPSGANAPSPKNDYAAFAPPTPSPEVEDRNIGGHLRPEDPTPFNTQTTIDLEPPPLSDTMPEANSMEPEPISSPFQIEAPPPLPEETEDIEPVSNELGEEDATVLMKRPERPTNS